MDLAVTEGFSPGQWKHFHLLYDIPEKRVSTLGQVSNSRDTGTLDRSVAGHLDVLRVGVWSSTGVVS